MSPLAEPLPGWNNLNGFVLFLKAVALVTGDDGAFLKLKKVHGLQQTVHLPLKVVAVQFRTNLDEGNDFSFFPHHKIAFSFSAVIIKGRIFFAQLQQDKILQQAAFIPGKAEAGGIGKPGINDKFVLYFSNIQEFILAI